jgi:predicted nucleotidyltransferase
METNTKILSSFKVKDKMNDEIWDLSKKTPTMHSDVRNSLLDIAENFISFLGFDIFVQDITMTGSLANYNWSSFSDIDLHIIFNYKDAGEQEEIFKDLFKLKKTVYNSTHDITVKGYEVELYVQDSNEPHFSTGVYSVLYNSWIEKPERESVKIQYEKILEKSQLWMDKIDNLIENYEDNDLDQVLKSIDNLKTKLKDFRGSGLEDGGEYSYENLTFKFLRRNGYIDKLFDFSNQITDKSLSL